MNEPRARFSLTAGAFLFPALLLSASLYAQKTARVVLVGSTIGLEAASIPGAGAREMGRRDIEAAGVFVTNEYHRRGYTTSYVERLVVTGDGTLEIHVRESRVLGVSVTGADRAEGDRIAAALAPETGELYNRLVVQERMEAVKERFRLAQVRVEPLNYRDGADVYLSVQVKKKSAGKLFGSIGVDPIYGLAPEAGYVYPMESASVTVRGSAGYRDGEFRKARGDVRSVFQPVYGRGLGFIAGIEGGRTVEYWESRDEDYTVYGLSPYGGLSLAENLSGDSLLWVYLYLKGTGSRIDNYRGSDLVNYEAAAVLDVSLSNGYFLLDRRESRQCGLSFTVGESDLEPGGYLISTADGSLPLFPWPWVRIVPRFDVFYTTSEERFYWRYVFDVNLLGFIGDFSASRWKNVAGLDMEFELSPRFLYVGPFVNGGLYLDEEGRWESAAGAGIKAMMTYKDIAVEAYYAWDLTEQPGRGGFYFFAESRY